MTMDSMTDLEDEELEAATRLQFSSGPVTADSEAPCTSGASHNWEASGSLQAYAEIERAHV